MFESFAGVDDRAVVAAIEESARVEAAAGARRLAAIAELVARRVEPDGDERCRSSLPRPGCHREAEPPYRQYWLRSIRQSNAELSSGTY